MNISSLFITILGFQAEQPTCENANLCKTIQHELVDGFNLTALEVDIGNDSKIYISPTVSAGKVSYPVSEFKWGQQPLLSRFGTGFPEEFIQSEPIPRWPKMFAPIVLIRFFWKGLLA